MDISLESPGTPGAFFIATVHRQAPGGKYGIGQVVSSSAPKTLPVFGLTIWTCGGRQRRRSSANFVKTSLKERQLMTLEEHRLALYAKHPLTIK